MQSFGIVQRRVRLRLVTKTVLRVMKLTAVLLVVGFLHVAASGYSQDRVTLNFKNVSLESVLESIKSQTGYQYLLIDDPNDKRRVSIQVNNLPLTQALDSFFKDIPFTYSVVDKAIIVKKVSPKPQITDDAGAPAPIDVKGRVGDSLGNPLAGASIQVVGRKRGVQTDANGAFHLVGLQPGDLIEVTYTGYLKRQIKVSAADAYYQVVLIRSLSPLDDIQIIAYGNVTQRLNTGNTVKVDSKTIGEQPVDNPISALEGRVPGLFIQSGQGLPGTFAKVQLRGISSIAGGTAPLYIVDGIPFSGYALNNNTSANGSPTVLSSFSNASGQLSPFNSINPSDIESVEVLKDADATAIYGSRGANGVILITTKRGKIGRTAVDIKVYQGWQDASHIVKGLNTTQFLQLDREAYANDKITPTPTIAPELFVWDSSKSVNYQKKILGNTSNITNADVTISGGTAGTRFLFGGNYFREGTVFPGTFNYSRGGAHLSVDHNSLNNRFITSFSTTFTSDQNNTIAQSIASLDYYPNYPLYDSLGHLNWSTANYLGLVKQLSKTTTQNLFGNASIGYSIIDGLKAKVDLGYNRLYFNGTTIYPLGSQNPAFNPVNKALYANNSTTSYIAEPQVEYNKRFDMHKITFLAGGSYQYQFTQGSIIQGQNYSNEALLQNLGAAGSIATFPAPTTSYTQYKYASVFGRLTYNFGDRYIVNGSFRRDGSSRFGPGHRFGNFGAVGAAWLFSNEGFVKSNLPWMSYGKLRGSYGTVGNDQIPDYQYLATYSTGATYQSTSSLQPSRLANPNYSWEITKKAEMGLELGFFKDRLLLTGSWFQNKSDNQLVGYPLSTQTGFTSYQFNLPATVQNRGIELSAISLNIRSKRFAWSTNANISFVRNKLVSYPGIATSSYKNTYVVGRSLSVVKGYQFDGINPANGLPQFKTSKGQDTIAPSYPGDYIVMGKSMPDFYGALNNRLSYEGFELDFTFQFVKQQGYLPTFWPGMAGFSGYMPPESMNRWVSPGQVTNVPIASTAVYNPTTAVAYSAWTSSNRFWGDASYMRLKNASLSYSFHQQQLNRFHLTQLRLFVEGQNLFNITKYPGSDPETPANVLQVPQLRTVVVGIQITL